MTKTSDKPRPFRAVRMSKGGIDRLFVAGYISDRWMERRSMMDYLALLAGIAVILCVAVRA